MMTGDRINEVGLCDSICNIPFKGDCPLGWWLGKTSEFYLCDIANLLTAKDCSALEVERPARVFRRASGMRVAGR